MFYDKAHPPTDTELSAALGPTEPLWHALRQHVLTAHGPVTEAWGFSGKAHGWALALKQKKRAVLYLKPLDQHFRASLALSEGAVDVVRSSGLSPAIVRLVEEAQRFPEGRAVRLEVRGEADVRDVGVLVGIRMGG